MAYGYRNGLTGNYIREDGELGTWAAVWSASPPLISDEAWHAGAQFAEPGDDPPGEAQLSNFLKGVYKRYEEQGAEVRTSPRPDGTTRTGNVSLLARLAEWLTGSADALPTISKNVQVNDWGDSDKPQENPDVAVRPTPTFGKSVVSWDDYRYSANHSTAAYSFSTDNGVSWTAQDKVPWISDSFTDSGNTRVVFDANGRAFLSGQAVNLSGTIKYEVFVARALDGNTYFEKTPTPAIVASSNTTTTSYDLPAIAVNRANGKVYVCYTETTSGPTSQVKLAESTDNGVSFTTVATVSDASSATGCSLDVESGGEVDVVWIKDNQKIMADRCSGPSWTCGTDTQISTGGSGTFTACDNINLKLNSGADASVAINSNPHIAVDQRPGGNNYRAVVWCQKTATPDFDVYFAFYRTTGTPAWLTAKVVVESICSGGSNDGNACLSSTDCPSGSCVDQNEFQFLPRITIDSNHYMQLLYYKRPNGSSYYNAYTANCGSSDGNFSTSVRVNDSSSNFQAADDGRLSTGDYIGISGEEDRLMTWADTRRKLVAGNTPTRTFTNTSGPSMTPTRTPTPTNTLATGVNTYTPTRTPTYTFTPTPYSRQLDIEVSNASGC